MIFNEKLTDAIIRVVINAVTVQWKLQGHNLTGKFIRSLEAKASKIVNGIRIDVFMEDYGLITNRGVSASRIPFQPGSGKRSSKYIEGLTEYAVARFRVSRQVAERIAFAIASKHRQEGMPTRNSRRFSRTGRRTEFLEDARDEMDDEIERLINEATDEAIRLLITRSIYA